MNTTKWIVAAVTILPLAAQDPTPNPQPSAPTASQTAPGELVALHPVRSLKGVKTRYEDVDMVIVRENTEGLYSGIENQVVPGVVTSLKVATEIACTRIARYAFRYATRRQRKKITVFHKANIMKLSDGLFLEACRTVAVDYEGRIEFEDRIVDNMCMQLVQKPELYDVLVLPNL